MSTETSTELPPTLTRKLPPGVNPLAMRGREKPLPTIPPRIKRLRYALVACVFTSTYTIRTSIMLANKASALYFLPTMVVALLTLALLFPLELAHHGLELAAEMEEFKQKEREREKDAKGEKAEKGLEEEYEEEIIQAWTIEKPTIFRTKIISIGWALCALKTLYAYHFDLKPHLEGDIIQEIWLCLSGEVSTAAMLWALATNWTPRESPLEGKAPKGQTATKGSEKKESKKKGKK